MRRGPILDNEEAQAHVVHARWLGIGGRDPRLSNGPMGSPGVRWGEDKKDSAHLHKDASINDRWDLRRNSVRANLPPAPTCTGKVR